MKKIKNLLVTYNELVMYQNGNASEVQDLIGKLSSYGQEVGILYYISTEKKKEIREKDKYE